MKNTTRLVIVLLFSIFQGCSVTKNSGESNSREVLNSWLGSTKNEILMEFGPPKSVTSDGNNGEILIYSNTKRNSISYAIHKQYIYINSAILKFLMHL